MTMTRTKKLWIGIGVLIFLSPIGVILPHFFKAQGAWGEWGPEAIEKVAGFVPEGMKRLGEIWKAPLPDYGLPGQGEGLGSQSFGYVVSAIVGVAFVGGIIYLLTKLLVRKNGMD
jgi:cobalt/nickel transport protein